MVIWCSFCWLQSMYFLIIFSVSSLAPGQSYDTKYPYNITECKCMTIGMIKYGHRLVWNSTKTHWDCDAFELAHWYDFDYMYFLITSISSQFTSLCILVHFLVLCVIPIKIISPCKRQIVSERRLHYLVCIAIQHITHLDQSLVNIAKPKCMRNNKLITCFSLTQYKNNF